MNRILIKMKVAQDDLDYYYFTSRPFGLFPKLVSEINAGLVNIGQTCYISSALQMIFQIPLLEKIFDNPKNSCNEIANSLISLYYGVNLSEVSIIFFVFV